ncbi:MAG: zinc ABC transporter substrate-binding protein [Phototrophicaceae bacterium]
MRKYLLLILSLTLFSGVSIQAQQDEDLLRVVGTTTQAGDALRIIAGDTIELTQLMGAGVDPHLYQPTEADIRAMNEAQLVVFSGLNLEGQFESVFEALGETETRTFSLGAPVQDLGFTIGGFDLSEEFSDVDDPHFWFDARNWQISIEELAEVLGDLNPDYAELYTDNATAYNEQLDLLFDWGNEALAQIPDEQRVLVTSHDAFQYFADAFGFEVIAIQGLSTQDEAGVGDIQGVVNEVVEREIPVMFVESSVPPNTIEAVQEAAEAQGWTVEIGVRELYSDAMGSEDSYGETYIGMLATNVITILQSFGYDVPEFPDGLEPIPPAEILDMTDTE